MEQQAIDHTREEYFNRKLKPKLKLVLPLYEKEEAKRVRTARRVLGLTGKQLLEQALAEFLDNHDL